MTDKLTQQWMLEHPNDAACPRTPAAAKAWRIKRGLELSDAVRQSAQSMKLPWRRGRRAEPETTNGR